MSKVYASPYSKEWYDELWGRVVVGIGSGRGREELVGIIQYVTSPTFQAEMEEQRQQLLKKVSVR